MRGERVESDFESTRWEEPDTRLESVDVDEHYEHKQGLGLRYGPEFRAARELQAANGQSCGVVALSETAAVRAGEFALHPVIMDGALHVFSAAGRTVDQVDKKLKLPVRFARILYLRPPGASARVRASVLHCNEELIEGRIGLYDADGLPCVLVDGFRAVSLGWAKRGGTSAGDGRDLLYHVDWQRTAADGRRRHAEPAPLAELRQAAAEAQAALLALRGTERLENVMVEEDEVAATQVAAGLGSLGVEAGKTFSAASLGVAPAMERIFTRLMKHLEAREWLVAAADGWKADEALAAAGSRASAVLRDFLAREPGHLAQGLLAAATGGEFAAIMRGEKDAVQVLFGGAGTDLLEQFYGDGLFSNLWLTAIAAAVQRATKELPEGRGLRILEVGAGTGGLASYILPLLEPGLHRYVFSDASGAFFGAAQQKLAAWPEVEYAVYNLDRNPVEQDLEAGRFDFIVGTNVLHAVADVRECLRNLHGLLAPGGTLFFMDVATPRLWTESIFGLTSGWWNARDTDLRPDQPLLTRGQWEELLRETGFTEATSLPGLSGPTGGEAQIGILARKTGSAAETPAPTPPPSDLAGTSWVVFADESGVGHDLAERLRAARATCVIVMAGEAFAAASDGTITMRPGEAADWQQLAAMWTAGDGPRRFVYLWSLDEVAEADVTRQTDALLHFSHALDHLGVGGSGAKVDLVTRAAQPVGEKAGPVSIGAGAILGLFRVLLAEHPNMTFRAIDLPADEIEPAALLESELRRDDSEREVAWRGEARYAQRLSRGLPSGGRELPADLPLRVESRERGVIDSLRFTPFPLPPCAPDEVLIKVKAAGLNFRDVLKALGLYPAETADARMYGDEVAGEVIAVGREISHVQVGDEVFGLAVFGLATHTLARGADVRRLPPGLTCEEAATVPVVFMTAWHALKNVARLRAGETVLVHAGAGGVGMAAIQIARHFGASVIASAGSPAKRALLRTHGSRSCHRFPAR